MLVGFEDVEGSRTRAARDALRPWRPRRVQGDSSALASRIRAQRRSPQVWLLAGSLRPNSTDCQRCALTWTVDCPERCVYQYGPIEAACEGLHGVDLVFLDSDGSAADGWLVEWLSIERACAPTFVLLLNLSLPNHGAWVRERLRALGYKELWWDVRIMDPGTVRGTLFPQSSCYDE